MAPNVTFLQGYQVVEIKGDEYARSVVVKSPEDTLSEIVVDGTFIEMALIPNTKMVEGLVELDQPVEIMWMVPIAPVFPAFSLPVMSLTRMRNRYWWQWARVQRLL